MSDNANPYDKAHELVRALTVSPIYRDYLAAKNELEKNPEYKEKVVSLRTRQVEVNNTKIMGGEVSSAAINEITLEFAKLQQIEEIARFLNTESHFIQLLNDIQEIIRKALEKDLGV
ncbi:MAG: YlbF family regulator [Syntrophomonadaceae bacterium]|nr:YlbF family regulator [Syntrophomonadaceae bacterium]MDD3888961.1 YlbF family regulator [Syntrophomonadaceae bacterium]MDD4548681.1 YlbF family regulator [Syntrophomonadaceae bacterium]